MPIGILNCNKNNLLSSAKECLSRRDSFKCERILMWSHCCVCALCFCTHTILDCSFVYCNIYRENFFSFCWNPCWKLFLFWFIFYLLVFGDRPLDNKSWYVFNEGANSIHNMSLVSDLLIFNRAKKKSAAVLSDSLNYMPIRSFRTN